jgi:LysM domain
MALASWVGWPLPTEVPTLSQIGNALRDTYIPDEFLVKALAVVCWLVWIELVASLLVEGVAYVRGRKAGAVPFAGGLQQGAARLIATVALLGSLLASKGLSSSGGFGLRALAPPTSQTLVTLVADEPPAEPAEPLGRAGAAVGARLAPPPTYEVQRRDTLWDVAERHLGDPFRWREIFTLNQGKVQPDGRCLTDPDLIHAGWQLELPDDAGGLAPPASAAPPTSPAPPASPAPPVSAPDTAGPTDDGGGMVLLDDGRDPAIVADAARSEDAKAGDDGGGMVLLPDDGAPGPAPLPPPVPQPSGDQIAAGEG